MIETLKKFGGKKLGGLILIAVIIIAFGFGGFGGGFSTNNQNNIAKINKTNVTTQDFMNYLNESGISQQAIRENLDNNIIEELLSGLISTTLIDLEVEDFDLSITQLTVLKKIKENKLFKFLTNSYVIIFSSFLVWMFFFDTNVQLNKEFKKEIKELNNTINFYKKEISKDKKTITELQDSLQLEKFAREQYLMKKENEDIYIIEHQDSIE